LYSTARFRAVVLINAALFLLTVAMLVRLPLPGPASGVRNFLTVASRMRRPGMALAGCLRSAGLVGSIWRRAWRSVRRLLTAVEMWQCAGSWVSYELSRPDRSAEHLGLALLTVVVVPDEAMGGSG
jgi:hypothetical protein